MAAELLQVNKALIAIGLYSGDGGLTASVIIVNPQGTNFIYAQQGGENVKVNAGDWHDYALTFEVDGEAVLYLDGEEILRTSFNVDALEGDFQIGSFDNYTHQLTYDPEASPPNNNRHNYYSFDGLMDEVALYEEVLTETQVESLIGAVTLERFAPAERDTAEESYTYDALGRVTEKLIVQYILHNLKKLKVQNIIGTWTVQKNFMMTSAE